MTANLTIAAVLFSSVFLTVVLNGFYLIILQRRKRLRSYDSMVTSTLLAQLAVVDILSVLLWTLFSALDALSGSLSPTGIVCDLQVYTRSFSFTANVFVFMLLMVERMLRIFLPSKHQEVCNSRTGFRLMFTIVIVCICISSMTSSVPDSELVVHYFKTEYQCSLTTDEATSYYFSIIVFTVFIPFTIIITGYIVILIRVTYLRRMRRPQQFISIGQKQHDGSEAYFFKLRIQYEILKHPDIKQQLEKKKPNRRNKQIDEQCYDNTVVDSSDDEFDSVNTPFQRGWFYLYKNDMKLTHIYAAISVLYLGLWLPYYIYSYSYTFDTSTYGDTFIIVAVCLSHCGGIIKVPLYFLSDNFRGAALKTFGIASK